MAYRIYGRASAYEERELRRLDAIERGETPARAATRSAGKTKPEARLLNEPTKERRLAFLLREYEKTPFDSERRPKAKRQMKSNNKKRDWPVRDEAAANKLIKGGNATQTRALNLLGL